MPKFNVWVVPVEAPPRQTRTFQTPAGYEFTLTVERPDITHGALARSLANDAIGKYITGAGSSDGTPAVFPLVGGPIGGRRIRVSEGLFLEFAIWAAMQPEDVPESERWTVDELIALSIVAGRVWSREVLPWLQKVAGDKPLGERDLGNGSAACEASSSAPLATEAASIHGSPLVPTAFSGRSTSDSAPSSGIPESGAAPVAVPPGRVFVAKIPIPG